MQCVDTMDLAYAPFLCKLDTAQWGHVSPIFCLGTHVGIWMCPVWTEVRAFLTLDLWKSNVCACSQTEAMCVASCIACTVLDSISTVCANILERHLYTYNIYIVLCRISCSIQRRDILIQLGCWHICCRTKFWCIHNHKPTLSCRDLSNNLDHQSTTTTKNRHLRFFICQFSHFGVIYL